MARNAQGGLGATTPAPGFSYEVFEMALAHAIKDKSEAAYRRGDALEKRRRLMQDWGRYCQSTPIKAAGNVVALHG